MKRLLPRSPLQFSPAEFFLLGVNLLPIYGVLFWGWQVFDMLLLFWLENVIIGIMNIAKMVAYIKRTRLYLAFPIVPFFMFHYGLFTAVHGVFVVIVFGLKPRHDGTLTATHYQDLWAEVAGSAGFSLAFGALAASHLFSFCVHFMRGGEITRTSLPKLMHAPYGRVVMLHLTVLLGGGAALALGQPVWALILLVLFKIMADLWAHRRSHNRLSTPAPSAYDRMQETTPPS